MIIQFKCSKIHSIILMDFLTPPVADIKNLTITDSFSPPTTALENLNISGRNTDKNKPRKQNHINPSWMLAEEESFRLSHLTALIRLFYQSWIRLEVDPSPHPSNNIVSAEDRINQLHLHASKRLSNREKFQRFRLMYFKRSINGELSNMGKG